LKRAFQRDEIQHEIKVNFFKNSIIKISTKLLIMFQFGMDFRKEHEHYLVRFFQNLPVFVTDFPAAVKPFYMKRTQEGDLVKIVV